MTVVNIDRDSKTECDDDRSSMASSHRPNHVAPATIAEDIDHEGEPEDVPSLPPSPSSYLIHHTSEQNLQLQPECSIGGEPGTKCENTHKKKTTAKQTNIPLCIYILRIYLIMSMSIYIYHYLLVRILLRVYQSWDALFHNIQYAMAIKIYWVFHAPNKTNGIQCTASATSMALGITYLR